MTASRPFRIGTRGSVLALTQTGQVADRLRALGHTVVVETISTRGDESVGTPIARLGGDGVFVRELEQALREGRIDAAVHSLKDLPTADVPDLELACIPARATPFDALVGPPGTTLGTLPAGAVVGTSSIRRVLQVRALRPDLDVRPVRGNVDTRLRRLDEGACDALVLAAAGLERMGLADRIATLLEPPDFWPAVAQGALVVQIRSADDRSRSVLAPLDDLPTRRAVQAERHCLAALAGGCLAPIGAWARRDEAGSLLLGGCVLESTADGARRIVAEGAAPADGGFAEVSARELGRHVADALRAAGADEMLRRMRAAAT